MRQLFAIHRLAGASARAALLALLAPLSSADFDYPDFSSTSGLTLVGSAAPVAGRLRLTPASNDQVGGAWHQTKQQVASGFETSFQFQLGAADGADGLVFLFQNASPNPLEGPGCELGYHGIANSVAIEFDTFDNTTCSGTSVLDPSAIHVSVHSQGTLPNSVSEAASLASTTAVPAFDDGARHLGRVRYLAGVLSVYVDDLATPVLTIVVDLSQLISLDQGRAWVGFTASTGGLSEVHELVSWSYDETPSGSGNVPPVAPVITEPVTNGVVLNPADVHMETAPFADPNPGDQHRCTDWEIWTLAPSELVWSAACLSGLERLHTHLGDGVFLNSHVGRSELFPDTDYRLRVRHSDDSGDPATEWSPWSYRTFSTGEASTVYALETEDVLDLPAPRWIVTSTGADYVLPPAATQPRLLLESGTNALVLQIAGNDGLTNTISNPTELPDHVEVRIELRAGSSALNLPETDLIVVDHECQTHRILLPAVTVPAGVSDYFWISTAGATYDGTAAQSSPSFITLARGLLPPWQPRQLGFVAEVFAEGLRLPVNIAFKPGAGPLPDDPFLYVTELYGKIRVVTRDGSVSDFATNLLNFNPTGSFPGSGEQGLTGIAVDPASGDVYASMLYAWASNPNIHFPKIVRFTSNDGGRTAATQTTILDMVGESQGQSHQISNLTIAPDGKLVSHMGDGFDAATAQNLSSFRGKILRLNLDGSPASDNPFFNAGDGINSRDYVWAYGVRNPFGGDWRFADGFQYEVENGPSRDRFAKVVAGQNYGWNGSDASMSNFAIYNWQPAHGPVNLAFVQPERFAGSGFPASSMGHAFITESGPTYATGPQEHGKRITEWILDANGVLVSGPIPFLEYAGDGKATACGLAAGPDGLYMTELYRDEGFDPIASGARIVRVRYDPSIDCDDNGVEDDCEIATGQAADANDNGIPDACECNGASFCQVTANSTGSPAFISSNGACTVADNAFVLSAAPVPNQPGIFYYGPDQMNGGMGLPFQDGFRCVGGGVFRLPVLTPSSNVATFALDFTNLPPNGPITAGSTWHFQYWYRDPVALGTGANLSDGLSVTFQ